ncbi:MAG: hypothetical protein ACREDS_15120, partial [Limisphaerales bacterium]
MFYQFAKELSHASNRLPVIWEVETALSAVLTETNESESPIAAAEIEPQARDVLGSRNLAPDMYEQCCRELEYVSKNGRALLHALAEHLTERADKNALRSALKPDRDKILEGASANDE